MSPWTTRRSVTGHTLTASCGLVSPAVRTFADFSFSAYLHEGRQKDTQVLTEYLHFFIDSDCRQANK